MCKLGEGERTGGTLTGGEEREDKLDVVVVCRLRVRRRVGTSSSCTCDVDCLERVTASLVYFRSEYMRGSSSRKKTNQDQERAGQVCGKDRQDRQDRRASRTGMHEEV